MATTSIQQLPPHLSADARVHVIVSILSGTQQAQSYYDDTLVPFLAKHNVNYQTHITKSTQTIIELTQDVFLPNAHNGVPQTIILLSGDGGIVDIVNTLASNIAEIADAQPAPSDFVKPVVCLVPHGTANALAWSSKVASDPLEVTLHGSPKPLPMFQVSLSPGAKLVSDEGATLENIPRLGTSTESQLMYGAVVFSWGLHASLVARSDTKAYRKHGLERFRMAAGELLEENHAYDGTIQIKLTGHEDWQPISSSSTESNHATPHGSEVGSSPTSSTHHEDEATSESNSNNSNKMSYLATTLVSNLEEKYRISPHQNPLSDKMHIIYLPHLPQSEIAELTFQPYQGGKHVDDLRVTYKEIDALKIKVNETVDEWRTICVDGKIVRLEENGWAQVRRLGEVGVVDLVVLNV